MQSQKRRPVVAGNWKMNGDLALAESFTTAFEGQTLDNIDVILCPPFTLLNSLSSDVFSVGAQTCSEYDNGAHTGEVSCGMIKACGAQYVILGHSERRTDQAESNQLIAKKVEACLKEGLTPILCIGESLEVRESGELFNFLEEQLTVVIEHVGIESFRNMVIAYEPIWAIGTGLTASPEQAQEVHAFIRALLKKSNEAIAENIAILYGGSVKGSNAKELFGQEDVDGGLIGGASLKFEEFLTICQAAN
ncbi:triose-phosphate isomerase [Alteromonadaceae bacterium M269]|nr:triose-phosphate isomerase [Alteromonadaceae bacterium M269]